MDGRETMGNSLGRAPRGRSDTEATREGGLGEIVGNNGESSGGKERYGSDEKVERKESVGNSLGRAQVGRNDMEATTRWTDGKPWEIAWGELCWEGMDGSNDWVDGEETV